MSAPYVLFCAGEDSGDILGESFVAEVLSHGLEACGAGGIRMQRAGLKPVVDFELLPVSGFGDVLPRYLRLRKAYNVLKFFLENPACVAFVAVDYPGFNMRLLKIANKLNKRILYVAPPQIWAWKKSRGSKLRHAKLAVLFDFEKDAYQKISCDVKRLEYPFLKYLGKTLVQSTESAETLLLLPGSRASQACRNLRFYLKIAAKWCGEKPHRKVLVAVARASLAPPLRHEVKKVFGAVPQWLGFVCTQDEQIRKDVFSSVGLALCAPGTASLELSLCGVKTVAVTVPDTLTYLIGSALVHIKYFCLPNIITDKPVVNEFIISPWQKNYFIQNILDSLEQENQEAKALAQTLQKKLAGGSPAKEFVQNILSPEFLG